MAAEFFEVCGGVGWCMDKCCVRFMGILLYKMAAEKKRILAFSKIKMSLNIKIFSEKLDWCTTSMMLC